MDVPTLSLFLRPIFTVFFSETGETGDIYYMIVLSLNIFCIFRYKGVDGPVKEKLKPLIVWFQEADSGSDDDEEEEDSD